MTTTNPPTTTFVTIQTNEGIENKPGSLGRVARCLSDKGINIEAYAVDSAGVRFLTNDPNKATSCLQSAGYKPQTVECFELSVADRPGELTRITEELGKSNVNIVTSFGVSSPNGGRIFLRVDQPEKAAPILARYARPTVSARSG